MTEAGATTAPAGALDGLRVIEVGMLVQGPQAAALLGQLGASVTKVELPGMGDQARWLPVSREDSRSAYYLACNRGKRSLTLDLRVPDGQEIFLRLLANADVLITNFKPGTMDGWGIGYAALAEVNPRLIYAVGSAFGTRGPDGARGGTDLSAQAAGGLISGTGEDGLPPSPVAVTISDHIGSLNLVAGVLAAVVARERTGRGQQVEASLLGSQIWAQASEYTYFLLTGSTPGRANRSNPMIPGLYGIFGTMDGWIAVAGVVTADRERFFSAIGAPELAHERKFMGGLISEQRKRELFPLLDAAFSKRTTGEWCDVLAEADIRYAPVRDYSEVTADRSVWDNGYLVEADPAERMRGVIGTPITMSDTPSSPGGPAPELGQHTEEVLLELGYDWDEILAYQDAQVV